MQAQPSVRSEHGHSVVQLVQRRGLDLQLGVEAAAQLQLVGDVREDQQNAAQRVRLAPEVPTVAEAGMVMIQAITTRPATLQRTAEARRAVLTLTILAMNLLCDALRDILDPRTSER